MSRLTVAGIAGIVGVIEAMHCSIATFPAVRRKPRRRTTTTGITRLVYRTINAVVGIAGRGLDALLARLEPALGPRSTWRGREPLLAALNGVLGDYLVASHNPLAIPMQLRQGGIPLPPEGQSLAAAIPHATGKLLVLLHGLCMSDLQWKRKGHDHGRALERDLGYTAVYLRYNSGLHISTNGRRCAEMLESLLERWPVPLTELVLIGHSMGGLVVRSACHCAESAGHRWLRRLDKIVFIGTPHHGAPLERGGNGVDRLLDSNVYSAPLSRLGKIRSTGITDLRFGNLRDEDWHKHDRFAAGKDRRKVLPLPESVTCYAIAATTGRKAGDLGDRLIGDGIVPLASALGRHTDPRRALTFEPDRQWVAYRTTHLDLLSSKAVYAQIKGWLAEPAQHAGASNGRSVP